MSTQKEGAEAVALIFERVSEQVLLAHPEDEPGRMLQSPGLKTSGRFYAFATRSDVVVKLPAPRVSELVATGEGTRCEPRKGRPMREWVQVRPADDDACTAYLTEARAFVRGTRGDVTTQRKEG